MQVCIYKTFYSTPFSRLSSGNPSGTRISVQIVDFLLGLTTPQNLFKCH